MSEAQMVMVSVNVLTGRAAEPDTSALDQSHAAGTRKGNKSY